MLLLVVALAPAEASTPRGEPSLLIGAGDEGVAAVSTEDYAAPVSKEAHAVLEGRSGSRMTGAVTVTAESAAPGAPLHVSIRLADAPPGNHAVFLHEGGDCSAVDAATVGAWFGPPAGQRPPSPGIGGEVGGPPPGYLGFVTVGVDGRGAKDLVLRAYTLAEGATALVDRAVVVYERAPDFTRGEQPGARQACGVLRAPPRG